MVDLGFSDSSFQVFGFSKTTNNNIYKYLKIFPLFNNEGFKPDISLDNLIDKYDKEIFLYYFLEYITLKKINGNTIRTSHIGENNTVWNKYTYTFTKQGEYYVMSQLKVLDEIKNYNINIYLTLLHFIPDLNVIRRILKGDINNLKKYFILLLDSIRKYCNNKVDLILLLNEFNIFRYILYAYSIFSDTYRLLSDIFYINSDKFVQNFISLSGDVYDYIRDHSLAKNFLPTSWNVSAYEYENTIISSLYDLKNIIKYINRNLNIDSIAIQIYGYKIPLNKNIFRYILYENFNGTPRFLFGFFNKIPLDYIHIYNLINESIEAGKNFGSNIFITEIGFGTKNKAKHSLFYKILSESIKNIDISNLKSFLIWSFIDIYEWGLGKKYFGILDDKLNEKESINYVKEIFSFLNKNIT